MKKGQLRGGASIQSNNGSLSRNDLQSCYNSFWLSDKVLRSRKRQIFRGSLILSSSKEIRMLRLSFYIPLSIDQLINSICDSGESLVTWMNPQSLNLHQELLNWSNYTDPIRSETLHLLGITIIIAANGFIRNFRLKVDHDSAIKILRLKNKKKNEKKMHPACFRLSRSSHLQQFIN